MSNDVQAMLNAFTRKHADLLVKHDPQTCIRTFDALDKYASYMTVPETVQASWQAIENEFGAAGFDAFQRITMLYLIADFEKRKAQHNYTPAILEMFAKSMRRIAASIADPAYEKYASRNDIMFKDLAICRHKIFPAGAQIIVPHAGFHRALLWRGGMRQAAGFARVLLECGNHKDWYQKHTHLSELDAFNPDGWRAMFLRMADMLAINPHIRGVWGGSWFYDPQIATLSPRLAYLRKIQVDNGAKSFFSQVETDGGALSKSKTRQTAYQEGRYLPKNYALIWPRRSIIAWARREREASARTATGAGTAGP